MTRLARRVVTATVADGQSQSGAVIVEGYRVVGIETPATMDGTAMTFHATTNKTDHAADTFVQVFDDAGSALSITIAASQYILLSSEASEDLSGAFSLKVTTAPGQTGQAAAFDLVLEA